MYSLGVPEQKNLAKTSRGIRRDGYEQRLDIRLILKTLLNPREISQWYRFSKGIDYRNDYCGI